MKRFLCLFIAILLAGCTPSKTIQTETSEMPEQPEELSETSEQSDGYDLTIARK